jgi:fatty acid desaturase
MGPSSGHRAVPDKRGENRQMNWLNFVAFVVCMIMALLGKGPLWYTMVLGFGAGINLAFVLTKWTGKK